MKNILITGTPRVGKTTLIERIISNHELKALGFITKEIRKDGVRIGFEIKTLSGLQKTLALKEYYDSQYKVGNYGVYVNNLELVVSKIFNEMEKQRYDLIVIDEIGKMELFSSKFKNLVKIALEQKKLLGTIMYRDNIFTKEIKNRKDTQVFELKIENRNKIKEEIVKMLI